ncbi:High_cysteine membrane protein [Hexamita inflata]|uniref:High cysteine membrane protein n=2 Tax=Hexamita inflata TaxID=28002 RepID=A0AA86V388_9EUKA|nr:High cysteine membrane protein [Hexamita inflata]
MSQTQLFQIRCQLGVAGTDNVISSIDTQTTQTFLFGGLTCLMNGTSFTLKSVSIINYNQFNINYIGAIGILFGQTYTNMMGTQSFISVSSLCLIVQMDYQTTSNVNCTGIIGSLIGNVSLINSTLKIYWGWANYSNLGLIGLVYDSSLIKIQNIDINIDYTIKDFYGAQENNIAVILGNNSAVMTSICNIIIKDIILKGKNYVGIIIGTHAKGYQYLHNIIINNIQLYGLQCASFVGQDLANTTINQVQLDDSSIISDYANNSALQIGAIVGLSKFANIVINDCSVNNTNLSIQGIQYAYASGCIGYSLKSNISINKFLSTNQNIANNASNNYCGSLVSYGQNSIIIIQFASIVKTNITSSSTKQSYVSGMIAALEQQCTVNIFQSWIQNSIVQSTEISQSTYTSGYISFVDSSIVNVQYCKLYLTSINTQTLSSNNQVGQAGFIGVITSVQLFMKNCSSNKINITVNAYQDSVYAAGIIGNVKQSSTINITDVIISQNNISSSSSSTFSAGFIGQISNSMTQLSRISSEMNNISGIAQLNSYSSGCIGQSVQQTVTINEINISHCKISCTSTMTYSGGLFGSSQSQLNTQNIFIIDTIISSNADYQGSSGGIIGYNSNNNVSFFNIIVQNCTIIAISGTSQAGAAAIIGYSSNSISELSNCQVNQCNLQSTALNSQSCYGGGIYGYVTGKNNIQITNSNVTNSYIYVNSGKQSAYSGGLVGTIQSYYDVSAAILLIRSSFVLNSTLRAEGIYSSGSGGLIGISWYANVTIQSSYATSITQFAKSISSKCMNGGIIGDLYISLLVLNNSYVSSSSQTFGNGQKQGGMLAGQYVNIATLNIISSYSTGINTIQGVTQVNCPVFVANQQSEFYQTTVKGC